MAKSKDILHQAAPLTGLAGLKQNWKSDLIAGFSVSLLALPLCLGIATASGMPPIAGIFAGIIGGLFVSRLGGCYITVTGPAAGLIVVILGIVEGLGNGDVTVGYPFALAAIFCAGLLQILFGFLRVGIIGSFFPIAALEGMLASIGLIIIAKQSHVMLGVKPESHSPLGLLAEIPHSLANANPKIAIIGVVSLLILVLYPLIKLELVKRIPATIWIIALAIPLAVIFDLNTVHSYQWWGSSHTIDPEHAKVLVELPKNILAGIALPDFSKALSLTFIWEVITIALVASIETLISAAAVEKLDPFRRQSNMNKELSANGAGTALSGMIGGLPMITEILRSSANVANGAKTSWSNFFHGAFLLLYVLVLGSVIGLIPYAALAAMLVFTGYRLTSPKIIRHMWHIGPEQLIIFLLTVVATLSTDLLVGLAVGVLVKFLLEYLRGAELRYAFQPKLSIEQPSESHYIIHVHSAAIFSNYLGLKQALDSIPKGMTIDIDFKESILVDYKTMDNLHTYKYYYEKDFGRMEIVGIHQHRAVSNHPFSARIKKSGD
jgi:MFS superfamily sulfate permease-like transporter